MKKLFTTLTFLAALIFATNTSTAQESFGSAGLEFALPVGDFADAGTDFGIGGTGSFEIGLTDNFAVLANAGIIFYSLEDITVLDQVIDQTLSQIPLQVGARYYVNEQKMGFFAGFKTGVIINNVGGEDVESQTDTYFSVAPEIGYFITDDISLALRYQAIFIPEEDSGEVDPISGEQLTTEAITWSLIGLRAAYNF